MRPLRFKQNINHKSALRLRAAAHSPHSWDPNYPVIDLAACSRLAGAITR